MERRYSGRRKFAIEKDRYGKAHFCASIVGRLLFALRWGCARACGGVVVAGGSRSYHSENETRIRMRLREATEHSQLSAVSLEPGQNSFGFLIDCQCEQKKKSVLDIAKLFVDTSGHPPSLICQQRRFTRCSCGTRRAAVPRCTLREGLGSAFTFSI